jgi:transposase InsO family protein
VDIHKNARLTPQSRELLVRRVLEQAWSMRAASEAVGVSERSGWKWLRRYREEGVDGLCDRSSRPQQVSAIPANESKRIVELRRCRLTCRQIGVLVRHSHSTVARVVARNGLSRLRSLDPPIVTRRYEHEHPGDLVHVDIKKLARIVGIGHRITGSPRRHGRRTGYEFLHVCIDDASRLTYAEILPCQTWRSAVMFMVRALKWFKQHGINVVRVISDNGGCYRSRAFRSFCASIGLKQSFTRPYRPQTNGKAERMIQTLLREWAYRFPFASSAQRTDVLAPYLHFYNHHRSHRGIGEKPPISRLLLNNVLVPNN